MSATWGSVQCVAPRRLAVWMFPFQEVSLEILRPPISRTRLTWVLAACYLKNNLGPTSYNAAINGARLVSQPSATASLSVSSVQATTASVATPTSTRLSCPASNGTYYTASSGMVFVIDCDTDYPGGGKCYYCISNAWAKLIDLADMDSVKATSLEECIEACDDEVSCSALVLSGGKKKSSARDCTADPFASGLLPKTPSQ